MRRSACALSMKARRPEPVRGRLAFSILAAVALLLPVAVASAGEPPVFHGVLGIRPAPGNIDNETGIGALAVKRWTFTETPDSNGLNPDQEPVIVAFGDVERLVLPAGALEANKRRTRFRYRDKDVKRGIKKLELFRRPNGTWRVSFTLVGIDLSPLTFRFPSCEALAVIVGDDDGFSGVEFDRPDGFEGKRVKVRGACADVAEWPWV